MVLRDILSNGRHPDIRWPRFPDRQLDVQRFYRDTGAVRPTTILAQWVQQGHPTPAALAIIQEIGNAKDYGLNPSDYDATFLKERAESLTTSAEQQRTPNQRAIASFDAALTIAIIRMASDLRIGRVNPKRVKFNFASGSKQLDLFGVRVKLRIGDWLLVRCLGRSVK